MNKALIITIIVMLILVGVTINVALNGGLFQKAKNASTQTQREIEREQLISTILGAYNSRGSFVINNVINGLPEDVMWCTKEDTTYSDTTETLPSEENWAGSWVITKNNNKFYIDKDGSVLDEEPKLSTNQYGFYEEVVYMGRGEIGEDTYTYFYVYFPQNSTTTFYIKSIIGDFEAVNETADMNIITGGKTYTLNDESTVTISGVIIESDFAYITRYVPRMNILENGNIRWITPELQNGEYSDIPLDDSSTIILEPTNLEFNEIFGSGD